MPGCYCLYQQIARTCREHASEADNKRPNTADQANLMIHIITTPCGMLLNVPLFILFFIHTISIFLNI